MDTPWGDVATWVTGIATIALFIIGFWQIRNEREARLRAEAERLSAVRRNQAEHVAVWIAGESFDELGSVLWVAVRNQSLQPIYHLVIHGIVLCNDGTPSHGPTPESQVRIDVAPPGEGYAPIHLDYAGMHHRAGIEIAFQDAANRPWLRKTTGELLALDTSPALFYEIDQPTGWESLLPDVPKPGESQALLNQPGT